MRCRHCGERVRVRTVWPSGNRKLATEENGGAFCVAVEGRDHEEIVPVTVTLDIETLAALRHFARLRKRVAEVEERGEFVSSSLFEEMDNMATLIADELVDAAGVRS